MSPESAPRPPATAAAAASMLTALVMAALLAVPAGAAPPTTATTPPAAAAPTTTAAASPAPPVIGLAPDGRDFPWLLDPRVDPDLSAVAVSSPAFDVELARYRRSEEEHDRAVATRDRAAAALVDLQSAADRLTGDLTQAERKLGKARDQLEQARATVRALAVDDYVRGTDPIALDVAFDVGNASDRRRQRVLVRQVRARELTRTQRLVATVGELEGVIARTGDDLADVRARIAEETATRDRAEARRVSLRDDLARAARTLADERLTGTVTGADFAFVALDAYVKAAKRLGAEQPSCGLRWPLLAAVGRTESRHGTFGGSSLDVAGNETKPIIGIALDGAPGVAAIGDTDGGLLDGDPVADRAVGPMQFIPSTWKRWARDGNGDGTADPQNMYDAALTAAVYLCLKGPGLDGEDGMRRALRSYNNDDSYGSLVIERARGYDAVALPPPPRR